MLFDKKSAEENYNIPCRDTGTGCSPPKRSVGVTKENTMTIDRGSPSGQANMFAAPLRPPARCNQPPPPPLERLRCADFVEKLRAYTQVKNFTKSSCHSKHVKSVIKEMIYDSISPKISSNKNTIRTTSNRGPEIERDSTNDQANISSKLYTNGRQEKPKLNKQNPDVRYLCDVTKCLTDTIKQFMDQSTSMTCPGQFLRTQLESLQISNQKSKSCNCCRVPTTCTCRNKTICTCSCKAKKLEAEILKWAQTIPVYPNQCINKQNQRDKMLKEFIDSAKAFHGVLPKEEFKDRMKEKAKSMLDTLPMWMPEGKREQEEFKKKLVDDLGERLEKLAPTSKLEDSGDSLADQIMRGRDGFDGGAGVSGLGGRRIRSSSRSDGTMGPGRLHRSMSQESFDTSEFERTAEQEILNYTDPLVANKSVPATNKRKGMAKDLARKAREILFEPEQEVGEQDGMVRDELSQFFRKLSLDSPKPREELVEDLSDKLKRLARSTPKKPKVGFGRGLDDTNMSSIYGDDDEETKELIKQQKAAEKQYLDQLEDVIGSWIDGLPVNLNITVDGGNVQKNAKQELATDVMDREKYNQLHPKVKATEPEELDLLKYQVFKRLNNKLQPKDVTIVIPRAESLMKKLKAVAPPDFTRFKAIGKGGKGRPGFTESQEGLEGDEDTKELRRQKEAAEKQYLGQLEDVIGSWMDGLPVNLNVTVDGSNVKENAKRDLAADVMDREKYNQFHPEAKPTEPEELNHLKNQIFKRLDKKLQPKDISQVIPRAGSLMKKLKAVAPPDFTRFKAIGKGLGEQRGEDEDIKELIRQQEAAENQYLGQLEDVIDSWMDDLPVDLNRTVGGSNVKENAKRDLAADVMDREKYNQFHPEAKPTEPEELNHLKNQIFKRLDKKLQPKDISQVIPRAGSLMKKLKAVAPPDFKKFEAVSKIMTENQDDPGRMAGGARGRNGGVGFGGEGSDEMDDENMFGGSNHELFEKVNKWVKDLPIPTNSPEEKEMVDNMKQELANKLITKIGGLHMDPNILNDDYAYDSIVKDEIDQFLEELPQSPEIEENKEALKADLVENLKETQQKAKEEFAGQAFKHQLRETVTKSLPKAENIEPNQQAVLEIIKDDIADALVDMNYEPDLNKREELQKKVEQKIKNYAEEIEKIKPGTRAETKKIKKDLVAGINKIPVPNKEFIKGEVEQVRMKDEIKEWAKELPLKPDIGPEEQIRANKIIALTARKLHKIEKEKAKNPYLNFDRVTEREIGKLIKKLPLKQEEVDMHEVTKKLIERLKNTEDDRQMKEDPRTSVTDDGNDACPPCVIPPCVRTPCGFNPPCNPPPCAPPPCPPPCIPTPPCLPTPPCIPRDIPCRPLSPCRVSPCTRPTWQPRTPKPRHTSRNMTCHQSPCNYHPKKHDCLNQRPCERPHFFRPYNHPCHTRQDEESQYGNDDEEPEHSPRSDDGVERCPRCCGMSCPHPSHLYFRN